MRGVTSQEMSATNIVPRLRFLRQFCSPFAAGRLLSVLLALLLVACPKAGPLTKEKADEILRGYQYAREPVYAEVPQKVWWNARSPKDDYDAKALRTFQNLQKAGYLT